MNSSCFFSQKNEGHKLIHVHLSYSHIRQESHNLSITFHLFAIWLSCLSLVLFGPLTCQPLDFVTSISLLLACHTICTWIGSSLDWTHTSSNGRLCQTHRLQNSTSIKQETTVMSQINIPSNISIFHQNDLCRFC